MLHIAHPDNPQFYTAQRRNVQASEPEVAQEHGMETGIQRANASWTAHPLSELEDLMLPSGLLSILLTMLGFSWNCSFLRPAKSALVICSSATNVGPTLLAQETGGISLVIFYRILKWKLETNYL